jgi:hypothetical protein
METFARMHGDTGDNAFLAGDLLHPAEPRAHVGGDSAPSDPTMQMGERVTGLNPEHSVLLPWKTFSSSIGGGSS